MSHYEKHLQADLERIITQLQEVARMIDSNLESATQAFVALDRDLASETIFNDQPVNRAIRALDHDCHAFVARHLPGARHLRFVSSALRLNIELERIGDYAASVGRETVQLTQLPGPEILQQIGALSSDTRELLRNAVQAFATDSVELANQVIQEAAGMERRFTEFFRNLTLGPTAQSLSAPDLTALLVILNRFSRVRAQAKNVGEETVFVVTGQPFPPKNYRILFVDREGCSLAPLAVAYASKAFPQSGTYTAAAVSPAKAVASEVVSTASDNGLSLEGIRSEALREIRDLSLYKMIVGLEPGLRDEVQPLPFHSIFLQRPLDPGKPPQQLIQDVAALVSTLITTLKGDEAD